MSKNDLKNVAIGCIMKQEEPYILEWVSYYLLLGFKIIIADNGGSDQTSLILSKLHKAGYIHRIDLTFYKNAPQIPAYRAILRVAKKKKIDIIGFLDGDEFFSRSFPISPLSINNGAEYILSLFKENDLTQLILHWITYGSKTDKPDTSGLVLERFSYHNHLNDPWNCWTKAFIKVSCAFSFKNLLYLGLPIFSIHSFERVDQRAFRGKKEFVKAHWAEDISHELGCVLHFQNKTWEEYQRRKMRGEAFFSKKSKGFKEGPRFNREKEFFEEHDFKDIKTEVDQGILLTIKQKILEIKNNPLFIEGVLNNIIIFQKIKNYLLAFGLSSGRGSYTHRVKKTLKGLKKKLKKYFSF